MAAKSKTPQERPNLVKDQELSCRPINSDAVVTQWRIETVPKTGQRPKLVAKIYELKSNAQYVVAGITGEWKYTINCKRSAIEAKALELWQDPPAEQAETEAQQADNQESETQTPNP